MARVVFTTWGSLGDLHPYLALAVELKRRGHDPIVASMPAWRANVERDGIGFRLIRPDVAPGDPNARELVRKVLDEREGPEFLFRKIFAPQTRETYDDTLAAVQGGDLLVSHQLPITAPIVAQQTAVTWVSAVLTPMGFLSAYDPPTLANAPWARGMTALHPAIAGTINRIGRAITNRWIEPLYRVREELGMPRGGHPLFEGQHAPARVLALFSRVLGDTQPDYPPQTVMTGFPFYDTAPNQRPADPELLRFLDAGDPPIVFTLGSAAVWVADDFYAVSIAAAQALGRRALLLVGENVEAMRAGLPDTIGVFDYAPHRTVMPRAGVIVHQGGIGTTAQALRAGRPTLVVPFGQDQPDNARRVVKLGVARTVSRGQYTRERVTRELSALVSDPKYAERARTVGVQVAAERGVETACDEIEGMLHF